jgi:hypothetical protein
VDFDNGCVECGELMMEMLAKEVFVHLANDAHAWNWTGVLNRNTSSSYGRVTKHAGLIHVSTCSCSQKALVHKYCCFSFVTDVFFHISTSQTLSTHII